MRRRAQTPSICSHSFPHSHSHSHPRPAQPIRVHPSPSQQHKQAQTGKQTAEKEEREETENFCAVSCDRDRVQLTFRPFVCIWHRKNIFQSLDGGSAPRPGPRQEEKKKKTKQKRRRRHTKRGFRRFGHEYKHTTVEKHCSSSRKSRQRGLRESDAPTSSSFSHLFRFLSCPDLPSH